MVINEFHSDLMQWGLRLLHGDPYNSSGYYGQMMRNDADDIYQGHYVRDHYETESNNVENDEIIARTLQEEFSQIAVTETSGYSDARDSHASNFVHSWHSPPRGNYYSDHDCDQEEGDSVLPSSSCSSPGDQEEYLHSLELADECTDDNQVHWNFDLITPIPHVPRINGEIPPSDEVTSDHQRLLDRLQLHDFIEHKVEGDGNCQFRALSDQLYHTPDHHKHVRHQVVNQLKSQPEIYEGYVPMAYDDYLEKMSKSGEWGDHVTLQAAADTYGVKIFVITSFKDPYCIEILPKSQKPKRGKLVKPLIFVVSEDICSKFSRLVVGFLKFSYFFPLQDSYLVPICSIKYYSLLVSLIRRLFDLCSHLLELLGRGALQLNLFSRRYTHK